MCSLIDFYVLWAHRLKNKTKTKTTKTSLLLGWMFEHECLDICCLICMYFVLLVFARVQRN